MAAMSREPQYGPGAIEPANMGELERLAGSAAKTGFFGAKSQEQALLVMMAGRDLGLSYSQALRAFHVIEDERNKRLLLVMTADGMVATCVNRREVCEYFRTIEATNERATVETRRVGSPEPRRESFSMQDAQRAGLLGKVNWQKYPSRMLLARARAALARDVYPDLLLGLCDPDELEATSPAPAREELRGEVVSAPAVASSSTSPPPTAPPAEGTVEALARGFIADFERLGQTGTRAEIREVTAAAAKLPKGEWRDRVVAAQKRAVAVVAEREKRAKEEAEAAASHDAQARAEADDAMAEVEHAQYDT